MSWILRDGRAEFKNNDWAAHVDLMANQPSLTIRDDRAFVANDLLQASIEPFDRELDDPSSTQKLGDAYVRQQDLVATFPESAPWRFGYQIDLRSIRDEGETNDEAAVWVTEYWLSIQTSLLDSRPELHVHFLPADFRLHSESMIVRESGNVAVMLHPLDLHDCGFITSSTSLSGSIRLSAFDRFMEKGVIRRARFQIHVARQSLTDMQWADRLGAFVASPLPLTT